MIFKAFNGLMAILFLLSAAVQLNDPDPVVWITLYVLAALFCLGHALEKLPAIWFFAFASFALVSAIFLVPDFWGRAPLGEVFGRVQMKSEEVEVAREFGGLMIVSIWMLALGLHKTDST